MEQITFVGDIIENSCPRLVCVLIIDTSEYMGTIVDRINAIISKQGNNFSNISELNERMDLAIVSFDTDIILNKNFNNDPYVPIKMSNNIKGNFVPAINYASEIIKEEMIKLYDELRMQCYKPWIVAITARKTSLSNKKEMNSIYKIMDEKSNKQNLVIIDIEKDTLSHQDVGNRNTFIVEEEKIDGIVEMISEIIYYNSIITIPCPIESKNIPMKIPKIEYVETNEKEEW